MTEGRAFPRQHAIVAAAFAAIALIQTWPLAAELSRVLPNDLGDPVLNTWILWWNAHAMPLTRGWWDAPMFFPTRGAMAFSETLIGLSIVASPLQWIGLSPVATYNLLFLFSFPLSALAAYLLAWSLTRRLGPSIVAGLIYGYAMFRFAHLGHIQILWSWFMPLALLGLHQWMAESRRSGLLLFGVAWLGESLSNGYYFLYFSIIVVLWLVWFTPWRDALRKLMPLLVVWVAAVACMSPVLLTYARVQQEHRFQRTLGEIVGNSADLMDFFNLSSTMPMSLTRGFADERDENPERRVGFGVVPTVALLVGVVVALRGLRRRVEQSVLAFYVVATLVAMLLALGPEPRAGGIQFLPSGPYAWLMAKVPGFTGVRVPARFTLIAIMCLAIATALLLARVRLASVSREGLLFGAIALAALLETWPRAIPMMPLPSLIDIHALTPDSAVLELPVGENQEFPALYRAMFHRHPLVNGYSGYTPKSYDELRDCLASAPHPLTMDNRPGNTDNRAGNPDNRAGCLTPVRRAAPLDVLIDRQNDRGGTWEMFISQLPDAQFRYHTRQFTVFHLPALAAGSR